MQNLKEFYERKEDAYHDMRALIGEREKRILGFFPSHTPLRVFDIGCGSGRFLRVLKNAGHDAIGMDLSESAVSAASESGVTAYQGSVEVISDLERAGGNFDVITALDVLEHTFDPARILEQLSGMLKPQGCIIASVPNIGSVIGRWTLLRGQFPVNRTGLFDSGHIRFFCRANLHDYIDRVPCLRIAGCVGTPLPAVSKLGLWRLERLQELAFSWLARHFPALWGYQLVFKLEPKSNPA